jgi:long-chain fatty acid transport protein
MIGILVRVIAVAFYVTVVASSAWVAGVYLYELGTPDLGTAAAGRAALAQDASTVMGNPAGMTRLDRSQLTSSLYSLIPSTQFDRGPGTTLGGGNGFNAGAPIPSLSSVSIPFPAVGLHCVYSLPPEIKLGVGAAYEFLDLGDGFTGSTNARPPDCD